MTAGGEGNGPARGLGLACAGLVAAAAMLWGGSVAVWFAVNPPGRPPIELTGTDLTAVPEAVALLALAGVAALVATGGAVRRGLGALLAACGAATAAAAVRAALADPFAGAPSAGPSGVPPGITAEQLRGLPLDATPAPALAVAGAAVLLMVGLFVLVRGARWASPGARYGGRGQREAEPDPDRAAWQDLDEGRDPTLGPAPPRSDPG